jgi:TatD DNase family protein
MALNSSTHSCIMNTKNTYPLIDIGANLGHESFSTDLEQIIDDAMQVGIEHIMVTGTSVEGSHDALTVAEKYADYCSSTAGIHPHEAANFDNQANASLRELASHIRVKAMGETGLDYFRDYSPRDAQQNALASQLQLAADLQMPVFLHQRDGHEDFIRLLREYRNALPRAVVHCFTGTEAELRDYLELDMHIGVTGWICDERRGHHLHEFIHLIPENRLMLETDAPYLLPRTIRPKPKSRRNVPANLVYVLAKVAECLGKSEKNVAEKTTQNARDFFVL